uniref:CNDH2_C domain-containing protein n=1 Tax=Syphacia muris TaxID=451379 RepID=A0A0N5AD64_9BILA
MASEHSSPVVCTMVASSSSTENVNGVGSTRNSWNSFNSSSPVCNSTTPSSSQCDSELTKLCLGGEIVFVPSAIIQDESLFRDVITKDAYRMLSSEWQQYLKRFLPHYEGADEDEEAILNAAFTDDANFNFGNAMGKVYAKIKCGYFNGERASGLVQLKDNHRVLYDHNIRHYYISLLKKLLIARQLEMKRVSWDTFKTVLKLQKLIQSFYNAREDDPISHIPARPALLRKRKNDKRLKLRSQCRVKIMLDDIKKQLNDDTISSDDEDLPSAPIEGINFAGKSTLYNPDFPDLDLHNDISTDEVKQMLKEYQHLKETQPDLPAMDISGITAEDVYQRTKLPCITEKNLTPEVCEALKQPFKSK